jgi:hypothetical protein
MNTSLNIVQIRVKRNPVNERWGIYRVYQGSVGVQEMLWTTSVIHKGAMRIAQEEAKKFGVPIYADPRH